MDKLVTSAAAGREEAPGWTPQYQARETPMCWGQGGDTVGTGLAAVSLWERSPPRYVQARSRTPPRPWHACSPCRGRGLVGQGWDEGHESFMSGRPGGGYLTKGCWAGAGSPVWVGSGLVGSSRASPWPSRSGCLFPSPAGASFRGPDPDPSVLSLLSHSPMSPSEVPTHPLQPTPTSTPTAPRRPAPRRPPPCC